MDRVIAGIDIEHAACYRQRVVCVDAVLADCEIINAAFYRHGILAHDRRAGSRIDLERAVAVHYKIRLAVDDGVDFFVTDHLKGAVVGKHILAFESDRDQPRRLDIDCCRIGVPDREVAQDQSDVRFARVYRDHSVGCRAGQAVSAAVCQSDLAVCVGEGDGVGGGVR